MCRRLFTLELVQARPHVQVEPKVCFRTINALDLWVPAALPCRQMYREFIMSTCHVNDLLGSWVTSLRLPRTVAAGRTRVPRLLLPWAAAQLPRYESRYPVLLVFGHLPTCLCNLSLSLAVPHTLCCALFCQVSFGRCFVLLMRHLGIALGPGLSTGVASFSDVTLEHS